MPKRHILHLRIESRLRWLMYSIPSTLHLSVPRSSHLDFRTFRAQPPICGAKPKPKAGNKRSPHSIRHGLDKPSIFTTVSESARFYHHRTRKWGLCSSRTENWEVEF